MTVPSALGQIKDFLAASESQDMQMIEPTCFLRWRNGVLHQKWLLTTYRTGTAVDRIEEWRPIPADEM